MTRRVVALGLLGAAVAGAYELISIAKSERYVPAHGPAFVSTFVNVPTALDFLMASGEGQFYAAIVEDPTLAHPERFKTGARQASYRWQRPALPYAAWVLSLGRVVSGRKALAAAVVLSAGFAVAACGALIARAGRPAAAGLGVLLLPGSLITLRGFGVELLALGAAAAGTYLFRYGRTRRDRNVCVLLFTLAVLSRESLGIVPVALVAHAMLVEGRPRRAGLVAVAAVPVAALLVWWSVERARLGFWPWQDDFYALGLPWTAFVPGVRRWSSAFDVAFGLAALAVPLVAIARRPRNPYAWVAAAHLPFAFIMGRAVWESWEDFGRPLLPLFFFGLLALAAARHATAAPARDAPA